MREKVRAFATSPEDTILLKLRWSQMSGGSSKQLGDVHGVFELQHKLLDIAYIDTSRTGLACVTTGSELNVNPIRYES